MPPTSSDSRRPDIQGLRALAVLVVVAFHAGLPVEGGFLGVDIFFVISGFVITAMLRREWLASGSVSLSRFYARRFRRLTPALAVLVAVVMLLSLALQSPLGAQQITAATGIGALLLVANLVIAQNTGGYFDAPAASNPLLHTWSLSVEEQFYLFFPTLLLVAWVVTRGRRRGAALAVVAVALATVLSLALAMRQSSGHTVSIIPSVLGGFYGPLTRIWEFGVGALLALTAARWQNRTGPVLPTTLGVLGVVLIGYSLFTVSEATPWPGPMTLLPVAGTLLLLTAGLHANPISRAFALRPLVAIGDISYSWYLWHWPLIVFAVLLWPEFPAIAAIAALASLLPSLISYRWVEQPIRRMRNVSPMRMLRIVTMTLAPPLALGFGLFVAATNGFWNVTIQEFAASVTPMHAGNAAGCNDSIVPGTRRAKDCVWNADASGKPVYLIGDSHADHFSEALIGAAQSLGRPLVIATANACPFDMSYVVQTGRNPNRCNRFVHGTVDWLKQQPAGTVVIASSSVYWNSDTFAVAEDGSSLPTTDHARKSELLEAGLTSAVSSLQEAGHDVVLVQDVPYFTPPEGSDPQRFSAIDLATSGDLDVQLDRSGADAAQATARSTVADVAASTGAQVVDVRDFFCTEDICSTVRDGHYLYRDDTHISIGASAALAGTFADALKAQPQRDVGPSRLQQFAQEVRPRHAGNAAGCNRYVVPDSSGAAPCVWNETASGPPVYLIGDSHADHFSEALIGATKALDRPLRIATANSCPFNLAYVVQDGHDDGPQCREFVLGTLKWLDQQTPGTVVLASSGIYWNSSRFAAAQSPTAPPVHDNVDKAVLLEAGLRKVVRQLQASGHRVVLAQDVPYFPPPYSSDPAQFTNAQIASDRSLATEMPLAVADQAQRFIRTGTARVAEVTGATLVDERGFFCPDAVCTTVRDGHYLYRDDTHISIAASRALSDVFARGIAVSR